LALICLSRSPLARLTTKFLLLMGVVHALLEQHVYVDSSQVKHVEEHSNRPAASSSLHLSTAVKSDLKHYPTLACCPIWILQHESESFIVI
jgi:hypothetical protein